MALHVYTYLNLSTLKYIRYQCLYYKQGSWNIQTALTEQIIFFSKIKLAGLSEKW